MRGTSFTLAFLALLEAASCSSQGASAGETCATQQRPQGMALIQQQTKVEANRTVTDEQSQPKSLIVKEPEHDQRLVVCNAYAHQDGLHLQFVRLHQELGALKYKACQEFQLPLQEGDQLDFHLGDLSIGTFAVSGLPRTRRTLLLVVHRRPGTKVGLKFLSHAFEADSDKVAQLAVIDAYLANHSSAAATLPNLTIATNEASPKPAAQSAGQDVLNALRSGPEEHVVHALKDPLRFNAVVAVSAGDYEVSMTRADAKVAQEPFHPKVGTSYVVLRVGDEVPAELGTHGAQSAGHRYPEELVVFPSGARAAAATLGAFLVLLAAQLLL